MTAKTKQNRNFKKKNNLFIGLPPNKRYRFTPLARHKISMMLT